MQSLKLAQTYGLCASFLHFLSRVLWPSMNAPSSVHITSAEAFKSIRLIENEILLYLPSEIAYTNHPKREGQLLNCKFRHATPRFRLVSNLSFSLVSCSEGKKSNSMIDTVCSNYSLASDKVIATFTF